MRVRANGGIIGPKNNKGNFTFAGDAGLLTSITALYICDSNYNNTDDVAISTSGGYIRLLGIGFSSGYSLYVNGVFVTSTRLVSSNEITAVLPANGNGNYSLTLFNSGGSGAIWAPGITYSGFPSWTTGTYSNQGSTVSVQLLATGDAPLTYSLQAGSTLPSGVTLSSSGLLSGTVSAVVNTVYSFTVLVDDAQLQTTQQAITLTVLLTDQYFNNTVLALHGDGAPIVPATIEILVVGGGGAATAVYGDPAGIRDSGGGGAGGVIYNASLSIASGNVYALSIGTGGVSANTGTASSGNNSTWNSTFIASGGGGGGRVSVAAAAGGSGGGGGNFSSSAGSSNQSTYSGWTVYGNAGGAGIDTGPAWGTGGGGGAGAIGTAGSTSTGGTGGIGISNSITGVATYYAGGGGGGAANGAIAAGGSGGGGASTSSATGVSGTPNTGGGGGGVGNVTGALYYGGAGGSGVTVIAYPSTNSSLVVSPGLTYTMSTTSRTGYKVYTFTGGSGTIYFPTNNNNTFLDSSNNSFVVTRNGAPTQGTFTPFSQTGWGGYFNGTTDWLTVPSITGFGTSNWTIEGWVNTAGSASNQVIIDYRTSGQGLYPLIYISPANKFAWYINTAEVLLSSIAITNNTWNHFAFVKNGSTTTVYVNGVSGGTYADSNSYLGNTPTIAASGLTADSHAAKISGYISNFRIVTGTAVYTSNFTPSTTLTAVSGTSLLTLQDNRFKDNSTNAFAITTAGTPSIQAFSPFAPAAVYSTSLVGGSVYFNGTTDYLTVPSNAALNISTGDWTIETWWYSTSAITQTIVQINYFSGTDGIAQARISASASSNAFNILSSVNGTGWLSTTPYGSWVPNAWYHLAYVRSGSNFTLYVNGVSAGTYSNASSLFATSGISVIGRMESNITPGNYTNGYISNTRVVKGTALYTANFTPPTAPLTTVTNTSLLLNGTNAAIFDQTAKNNLFTANTANVSTTQSKFGGSSMYFNGTTDYLSVASNPNFAFGTANFTIEMWINPTTTLTTGSTQKVIISRWNTSALEWLLDYSNGNLRMIDNSTANILNGAVTLTANTWYHIAVCRSGITSTIFVNGSSVGTINNQVFSTTYSKPLLIGFKGDGTVEYWNGYIDDLRITKGIARYTANFTPSAYAFQDQ